MIAFSAPTAWAAAQETETGIQKPKELYIAAFNKGDAAGVADMYTDTAYLMPRARQLSLATLRSRSTGTPGSGVPCSCCAIAAKLPVKRKVAELNNPTETTAREPQPRGELGSFRTVKPADCAQTVAR
jgi:hypothetical protein